MNTNFDLTTPILIAGAGSTGLSLAGELGWRNVSCMVVEPFEKANPHPRANAVANRTMEYFRRWGIDRELIGAGVPADVAAQYAWVSTLHGQEIYRLSLPGHAELERIRAQGAADPRSELHWSPYLKTIVGQDKVESALRKHLAKCQSVDVRYGWRIESYEEHADAVLAQIVHDSTGEKQRVRCNWLVGCDGGRSRVREIAGIPLSGRSGLANFVSIYFKATDFMSCHGFGLVNIFFPLHKRHRGFLLNWDTGTTWTYHLILEPGTDWRTIDPKAAILSLLGCSTELEIISIQPWTAHGLTATRYQSDGGRVFLAGDAAHLFTPTGGLGMNTGVSDAIDLAWRLDASVAGWAGEQLLASYGVERQPIGVRNTGEAADNFDRLFAVMQCGDELDAAGSEGDALRAEIRDDLHTQDRLMKSSGVLLGYRYENSPICVPDGTDPTPDDPRVYTPVGRPGHRAPHTWLADGRSILDTFGHGFTLLCFDGVSDGAASLREAADSRGLPLKICSIEDQVARELYGNCAYALVRPDLMVAWRGNFPTDSIGIIDRVRGARPHEQQKMSGSAS